MLVRAVALRLTALRYLESENSAAQTGVGSLAICDNVLISTLP